METFKAWRELIRAVKDIAIAIGGDNKNNGSTDNIKFWKESIGDEHLPYIHYIAKVDQVLKNNIVNPAVK